MHLRLPSIAPGVKAFLWALGLAAYVFFGLRSIAFLDRASDFILAALAFCAIFLFVRIFGAELRD
jgi:hypothetical protein